MPFANSLNKSMTLVTIKPRPRRAPSSALNASGSVCDHSQAWMWRGCWCPSQQRHCVKATKKQLRRRPTRYCSIMMTSASSLTSHVPTLCIQISRYSRASYSSSTVAVLVLMIMTHYCWQGQHKGSATLAPVHSLY